MKKILQGDFSSWDARQKAVVSGVLLCIGILVFSPEIYKQFIQPKTIETLPEQEEAFNQPDTKIISKTHAHYENEVFGSTVNKFIVEKEFSPIETQNTNPNIELREDKASKYKQTMVFSSATNKQTQLLPKHQYNQFQGEYRVIFSLKGAINANQQRRFNIQIIDPQNGILLAEKTIENKDIATFYTPFILDYEIKTTGPAPEIRVSSNHIDPIFLEHFIIQSQKKESPSEFSIEDTFSDVPDPHASQGSARLADPEKNLPGTMLFGPYDTTLKAGEYMAEFRIKTTDTTSVQPIIRIQTANLIPNTSHQTIHTKELKGTDFEQADRYESFTLPATATEDGFFEIRAYFYDISPIWIDSVRLYNTNKKR